MRCYPPQTYILAVILMFFALPGTAQIIDKWKGKNIEKIMEGTVLVRVVQSDSFNSRVEESFKKYWKTSPFKIYDSTRFTSDNGSYALFSPGIVSLQKVRSNYNRTETYTVEASASYPFFVYGETFSSGNRNGEGMIGIFPINSIHYEFNVNANNEYEGAYLRMPYIIYNLNDIVSFIKNKGTEKGYYEYLEEKAQRIGKKTLIIPRDLVKEWDVNPNTTAMMKNNFDKKKNMKAIMHKILDESDISFGGKYKVMSTAEIVALENSPDASKYTLFLPAIDDKKYMMVYDLATKELLYFEQTKMSMKIKDKDFDKLNKAAGF